MSVKLALIGGGGFRTPTIYEAALDIAERVEFDELVLYDIDALRMQRIGAVLAGITEERGARLPFRTTTELDDAVEGADFVFCAIRVGGLEGRIVDEEVPLREGVLGQETTGPGGICFALRTVPVMLEIAKSVARLAPNAWFLNFTNPAGLVTEAIQQVLGDRAIGICDSPAALCRRVASALGHDREELSFDYVGLNHLGWLRAVRSRDGDLLPGLLLDDARLRTLEEGRLFGPEWLRTLGMIPNEYLYYHYYSANAVDAIRGRERARGEQLLGLQQSFYGQSDGSPKAALASWRAVRTERERTYMRDLEPAVSHDGAAEDRDGHGEGYGAVAVAVLESIVLNRQAVLILNVANRGSLGFLDADSVVEVPCVVGGAGAVPVSCGDVALEIRGAIETIKAVERMTIAAAVTASRELALKALALHPLVDSVDTARRILEAYVEQLPELEEQFAL